LAVFQEAQEETSHIISTFFSSLYSLSGSSFPFDRRERKKKSSTRWNDWNELPQTRRRRRKQIGKGKKRNVGVYTRTNWSSGISLGKREERDEWKNDDAFPPRGGRRTDGRTDRRTVWETQGPSRVERERALHHLKCASIWTDQKLSMILRVLSSVLSNILHLAAPSVAAGKAYDETFRQKKKPVT
jgi:hypothetical protein